MNIDTLIQQKKEELRKAKRAHIMHIEDYELDFLESTIREVAGMVCEEIVPKNCDERNAGRISKTHIMDYSDCLQWNDFRAEILATAKEKGFIK